MLQKYLKDNIHSHKSEKDIDKHMLKVEKVNYYLIVGKNKRTETKNRTNGKDSRYKIK
jgi:hypothetical protein